MDLFNLNLLCAKSKVCQMLVCELLYADATTLVSQSADEIQDCLQLIWNCLFQFGHSI